MKLKSGNNISVRNEQPDVWRIDAAVPQLVAGRNIHLEKIPAGVRINASIPATAAGTIFEAGTTDILVSMPQGTPLAGQPVKLNIVGGDSATQAERNAWNNATPSFTGTLVTDNAGVEQFAVMLEDAKVAGTPYRARLYGPVWVTCRLIESHHDFVVTGTTADGVHLFQSDPAYGARILWRSSFTPGTVQAVVMLDWHGVGDPLYAGQFQAVYDPVEDTVLVRNGLNPDSPYAGLFTWGAGSSSIEVPKAVFPRGSSNGTIYLRARLVDGAVTAGLEFVAGGAAADDRDNAYVPIASFNSVSLNQLHKSGPVRMYWRV